MKSSDFVEQKPESCSDLAPELKYDPRIETVWTILCIPRYTRVVVTSQDHLFLVRS